MRCFFTFLIVLISGCSTMNYSGTLPSQAVAQCIANEWRRCGATGYTVPVRIDRQSNGYFVGVELRYCLDPLIYGKKHPEYAVWAEVTDSNPGSATEYHRAMQISHNCIDNVVRKCQEQNQ